MYNFDHICKETSRNVVSRFSPFWATDFLSCTCRCFYLIVFSLLAPCSSLARWQHMAGWLSSFFSNAKTMLLTAACMLDFGKPKKVPFLLIIGSAMSITCLDKAKLFPEAMFFHHHFFYLPEVNHTGRKGPWSTQQWWPVRPRLHLNFQTP